MRLNLLYIHVLTVCSSVRGKVTAISDSGLCATRTASESSQDRTNIGRPWTLPSVHCGWPGYVRSSSRCRPVLRPCSRLGPFRWSQHTGRFRGHWHSGPVQCPARAMWRVRNGRPGPGRNVMAGALPVHGRWTHRAASTNQAAVWRKGPGFCCQTRERNCGVERASMG